MIDLIYLTVYLYSLYCVFIQGSISAFIVTAVISMIFVYKYKNQINNYRTYADVIKKQKEYFIETLKHDLQVPLIAQLRGLQLFENIAEINREQEELLKQIKNSCKYSLDMISMFIDGENELYKPNESEIFNFLEVLELSIEELKDYTKDKNLKFICSSTVKNPLINADKESIKKVVINLLSNAINHAMYNENIYIKTENSNNSISIYICTKNKISKNTKHFSCVGENLKLNFCKKILYLHNGHMLSPLNNNYGLGFEIPAG